MSEGYIFWQRPLRLVGPCPAETAAARLRALLTAPARFSAEERLLGRIDGRQFRVWKKTLLGASADVVQLEGRIEVGPQGSVIEGTLSYRAATKLQFVGFLVLGLVIAASGVLQKFSGSAGADQVILFGGALATITGLWVVTARHMKGRQIEFLESRLQEVIASEDT